MNREAPKPVSQPERASQGFGPVRSAGGADAAPRPVRQLVFDTVRSAGRIARVNVAKALDVSPATVTTAVTELIESGLVREIEAPARPGNRGRPPVALALRSDVGAVIGVKVSEATLTATIIDFAGRVMGQAAHERASPSRDVASMLDEIEDLVDSLLARSGVSRSDVLGVGAGLPGIVDHGEGRLYWSPILNEHDIDLRQLLSRKLGMRVAVDNDTNLLTLAELWFGRGREVADFAVVTIEQGIGMGLVLDHQLFRGAHSAGLELGHMKVQLDGALCRCGQRGCLEAYVSDYALVREASTALDLDRHHLQPSPVILESLYDQAKAGHDAARMIFRRAGRFMALGLANVASLFDPSLIILSGARMRYEYLYAEEVLTEMRALSISSARVTPRVEINAWGDQVWARGAAALALSMVMEDLTSRSARP